MLLADQLTCVEQEDCPTGIVHCTGFVDTDPEGGDFPTTVALFSNDPANLSLSAFDGQLLWPRNSKALFPRETYGQLRELLPTPPQAHS